MAGVLIMPPGILAAVIGALGYAKAWAVPLILALVGGIIILRGYPLPLSLRLTIGIVLIISTAVLFVTWTPTFYAVPMWSGATTLTGSWAASPLGPSMATG